MGLPRVTTHSENHLHTMYSPLDGYSTPRETLDRCREVGVKSLCITEHAVQTSWFYFAQLQKDYPDVDIKYGVEFYEALDHTENDPKNKYYHLILVAKNQKGLEAINELITQAEEGFYYKPRIDLEQIRPYGQDLICSTACLASKLSRTKDIDQCIDYINDYKSVFGDGFYLEIQCHDDPHQIAYNRKIIDLAKQTNTPYMITADVHYAKPEMRTAHSYFVNINRDNADVENVGEIYDGCYIHETNEIYEIMIKGGLTEDEITIGLENSIKFAKMSTAKVEFGEPELPKAKFPAPFKNEEEYFKYLIMQGWNERIMPNVKDGVYYDEYGNPHPLRKYQDRMKEEFEVMTDMGFIGYHLIVQEYVKWAKDNGIPTGNGRGSASGSLINYLLYITNIEPVANGLMFSRYLNKERVSMPDIDSDFSSGGRRKVFEHLEEVYGKEYVAQIINFSFITPKVAVKDAGRCLGKKSKDMDSLSEFMTLDTVQESLEVNSGNEKLSELIMQYQDVIELASGFEGRIRNLSTNACFTEDTRVMTSTGFKMIKDVEKGDLVLTHTNTFKPVVNKIIKQSNDIYELKTKSSFPIKATGNHQFLTRRKSYGKKKKISYSDEAVWKELRDIDNMDMVGIAINQNSTIPQSKFNLPFENKDFWWVIGRYIGDGWCENPYWYNEKTGVEWDNRRLIICCSKKDSSELTEITEKLDNLLDYRVENARTTYKIYIKNKEMWEYVQQFGKYAHGKKLTSDVFDLPLNLLNSFVEGYMSADGHYDKKENTFGIKTVSKDLAIGFMSCVNKLYKKHCSVVIYKPKQEIIEGRLVQSKEKYQCRFAKEARSKEKSFYEDGYIWTQVRSVEKTNEDLNVYDLSVLDDNTYTANSIIVHNCGAIISSKKISNFCGTMKGDGGEVLLQVDKVICEALGMVKMDLLGLNTLDIVEDTMIKLGKTYYDINDFPLDDKATYDFLAGGKLRGVFQLEGNNMTKFFMKLKPQTLDDICSGISLYRPGAMQFIDNFLAWKEDNSKIKYLTPLQEDALRATFGCMIYQEQVQQILGDLAGFSYAQGDLVRRGMAKKIEKYVLEQRDNFIYGNEELGIKGCVNNGVREEDAIEIFNEMTKFAEYAFNKSHGFSYGKLTYHTAYLLTHHPLEYMSSLLSHTGDNTKISQYLSQCIDLGLKILSPDINKSELGFSLHNDGILYGIGSLNNVGKPSVEQIVKNRPYTSFNDFMQKNTADSKEEGYVKLNKSCLLSLINSGAFDELPMTDGGQKISKDRLIAEVLFGTISMIKSASTTNIPEIFENNLLNIDDFKKEKRIYDLHKEILTNKSKFDIMKDDTIITRIKNTYTEECYEIEGETFKIIKKKYDKEYDKHLKKLKETIKENGEELAKKINKLRLINEFTQYKGGRTASDLEFESTSFYFSDSWLTTAVEDYGIHEFNDIPDLNMDEVGYYSKKQLYYIAGVLIGKNKKHNEIIVMTNSGCIIVKLGQLLYNTVASDLKRCDKLFLEGYRGNGFFRCEHYEFGKSNKLKALKVI